MTRIAHILTRLTLTTAVLATGFIATTGLAAERVVRVVELPTVTVTAKRIRVVELPPVVVVAKRLAPAPVQVAERAREARNVDARGPAKVAAKV